ncbi:MAG: dienelactone hydrolase family protein [Verrucomicrobiae bacterium]|nr:dienelactone hydrolase family protein [Verrucomicrobiae bacterium]
MHAALSAAILILGAAALSAAPLPGTQALEGDGDLSAEMVAGIGRFLDRETAASVGMRNARWKRDFSSREAYVNSVETQRARFKNIIGVVDKRLPVDSLSYVATTSSSGVPADTDQFRVFAVRWPVLDGVSGEGLLLQPKKPIVGQVVAIPDADQTPEQLIGLAPGIPLEHQYARWLAASGVQVVIPTLVSRAADHSGNPRVGRFTNQPHREWIYRQAFEMGRHVIGYEVQRVLAVVDWFRHTQSLPKSPTLPIGVIGNHEGGQIAFYAAACDPRIQAVCVSGYFQSRQELWREPIYRNIFGLLRDFGDAEIATLISPRQLIIEHSEVPAISGPPAAGTGRSAGAAPGVWSTPDIANVSDEWRRAVGLLGEAPPDFPKPVLASRQDGSPTGPGSPAALIVLLQTMGIEVNPFDEFPSEVRDLRTNFDPAGRQQRMVQQLENHVQGLLRQASAEREAEFWKPLRADTPEEWSNAMVERRRQFKNDVIGWFDNPRLPLNPRSRIFAETENWTGHEIVLDVWNDVFAWGYLLLPKNLKEGERRPVVVCQHGLEGLPGDVINEDKDSRSWRAYKAFAARLAERGFVVFAPHNPYRGKDAFRELQRKLNPLGRTLFSVITRQHEAILDWLQEQPFVDADRIGFYGLSYGGKSAMRIPAIEQRYSLSICSADFNEWVWKNASVDWRGSYMFTGEYEIYEWNLGHTFNYAEMAALICPRPFMVERGHSDGVGIDEWVAFEYAKIRRMYDRLSIGPLTQIEWFNGPHTINGQGTYRFLHEYLGLPIR